MVSNQNTTLMSEEFLQYIWKFRLFQNKVFTSQNGETVEILSPGEQNFNSGPDFINTRIKINGITWAGCSEVHKKASDWHRHNHHLDKAYDNTILHIVEEHDADIKNSAGQPIPFMELKYDSTLLEKYKNLVSVSTNIPCKSCLPKIERIELQQWLTKLMIERLEKRTDDILQLLNFTNNHWEEAFYIMLCRNLGFKVNAEPFEMLARSLPLQILAKHKNNIVQLEALLFGQASFLSDKPVDEYCSQLATEYEFLKKKYQLAPLQKHVWKFMRLRPANFPTIRLAQLASLINNSSSLFSKIIEAKNVKQIEELFNTSTSAYWENHYMLGKISPASLKKLSKSSIDLLTINTIIPFLFVYGRERKILHLQDKAFQLAEAISAEKNSIIAEWKKYGVRVSNAFESQALLQLYNNYCTKQQCLHCAIGHLYLTKF